MPQALPTRLSIGAAEPRDAVAMFQRRSLLAPTFRWDDLWQAEHSRAFMVAGVAQSDVLRLFQTQLQQALASGTSLADFQEAIKPQLLRKGWWGDVEITDPATGEIRTTRFNSARLQLIYDTNLRQSYAAGRWDSQLRNKARKPFLVYLDMEDERVRESHHRWHGVALPIDHDFWLTHYAPNGWRCRCRVIAVNESDLQRLQARGVRIRRQAPEIQTVEIRTQVGGPSIQQPVGIDPGFAYNPGQASLQQAGQLQQQALDALPANLATAQVRQAVQSRAFERFVQEPLPQWSAPVAVMPQALALGATSTTVVVRGDELLQGLDAAPADYQWVHTTLTQGRQVSRQGDTATYLLQRDGQVALVRIQLQSGQMVVAQLRVLPLAQAQADAEMGPLLKGGA